ncbi:ZIP family metal transporter [Corynebacterium halotolerans]|uniref:ZIP family zinc transporte n=1 Tax=Corynebacterium halotolerans YIM 70093 = DSM 44683 TaxID=1121362 RepID=M1PAZ3_9CORY|nr:ZIP family metal transporter [Corynebacterium halotolerans]AGF73841.1 ZIP family zinc transporte [Corynebacterium halotolerans YIM 70093 = DSM 44683]
MQGFALVLVLAALPAAGNFLGGLASEVFKISERALSLALHLAAGIVLAVVGLELMPEAFNAQQPWAPVLSFAVGGVLFMGIERLIGIVQNKLKMGEHTTGPLAIFSGVSLDLFSDGVMIGTATVLNPSLGLLLALGQVPADFPEGFAAVASMRQAGIRRRVRILMALSFVIPIFLGATIGYFALRDAPDIITLSVLAMTGGVLTSVVVEEMMTEAHESETSRFGPLFLTVGFALFALISVYLGF